MLNIARILVVFILSALVAGCGAREAALKEMPDLGNFQLHHNIVVGETARIGPLSREATAEEWEAALGAAIDDRLGDYQGDTLYHLGTAIEAYVLAVPGVPVVVSPKSVLVVGVTLYDRGGDKLNDKPMKFTVFETLSGETVVGSGLTQSKEVQMQNLSRNAAHQIVKWLETNRDAFFGDENETTEAQIATN